MFKVWIVPAKDNNIILYIILCPVIIPQPKNDKKIFRKKGINCTQYFNKRNFESNTFDLYYVTLHYSDATIMNNN